MKYIRVKRLQEKRDVFVLFPKSLMHVSMTRQLEIGDIGVMSAGFVTFTDEGPECYGESIGLGISGRPDDTEALRRQWVKEE